jgi:phosphoribosylaminoimidazolecarboxamide formyltransferase/IMP cyclohydrolase
LIRAQAVAVTGTEAAAFLIEHHAGGRMVSAETIVHIRPDQATEETLASAVTAFKEIIKPAIEQDKNGVILIEGTEQPAGPQYCLITLLRKDEKAVACSAIIARAPDQAAAQKLLMYAELVANYFELLEPEVQIGTTGNVTGGFEQSLAIQLSRKQDLRYGENPHQKAALFVDDKSAEASVAFAKQLHGKELSYINLLDADGALSCVKEFDQPAACIVKHTTPCGCAVAADLPTAFQRAYDGDPLAAFGGIVALNRNVDLATAQAITSIKHLLEVIVAPGFAPDALELLRSRWKNVRLLEVGPLTQFDRNEISMHKIVGGYLVQQRDLLGIDDANWKTVSERKPTDKELADLKFAWLVCKHVKSNAIAIARDGMLVGAGAGQMDRVSSARLAIEKAGSRVRPSVAASDAFFPFPDGPQLLLDAGVTAIIQPGGAMKDQDSIDAVNRCNAAMIFTGQRHFKH